MLVSVSHYSGSGPGYVSFVLRADADGENGADTNASGAVMVEGEEVSVGEHAVSVYAVSGQNRTHLASHEMYIGPLLSELEFSPDILASATLCPYRNGFKLHGQEGYGLRIDYVLNKELRNRARDEPVDLTVEFEDLIGDEGTHELKFDPEEHKHLLLPERKILLVTVNRTKEIKWEGFNKNISDEDPEDVYMWDQEAEKGQRGVSPDGTVAEGDYQASIAVTHPTDDTQEQNIDLELGVLYLLDE